MGLSLELSDNAHANNCCIVSKKIHPLIDSSPCDTIASLTLMAVVLLAKRG